MLFWRSVFDDAGGGILHEVAVQGAVHLPDAVAGHRRPVRVDRADGERVRGLRLEQPRAALLELGEIVGRQRVEPDAFGPKPAQLAEREPKLRDGDGQHISVAVVELVGQIEPFVDVRRTRCVLIRLDAGETSGAQADEPVDVVDVGAREQGVPDRRQRLPILEECVERRCPHERRPGARPFGETPCKIEKRVARPRAVLKPLEGEA